MKGWQVVLLCLAVVALAVTGTLLFIRQTEEEATQEEGVPLIDIPRYTADQVIAVAKAYAGEECAGRSIFTWGQDEDEEPHDASWKTVYLGHGKWKVTKECYYSVVSWIFFEATGEIK